MATTTFRVGGGIPPGFGRWQEKEKPHLAGRGLNKEGAGKRLAALYHALRCWAMGLIEDALVGLPWRWCHRTVDRILSWREREGERQ